MEILNTKIKEFKKKLDFLEAIKKKLYKDCLIYIKEEFEGKFSEVFIDRNINGFLDEFGLPNIMYKNSHIYYSISNLSGAERVILQLYLLSIILDISDTNRFYLIDEPNELLDSYNIGIIRKIFLRIFKNKQVIICTFIENYETLQPALVHLVKKLPNNLSYISHQKPTKSDIKNVSEIIVNLLKDYLNTINTGERHIIAICLKTLFINESFITQKLGFKMMNYGNTIKDNNFEFQFIQSFSGELTNSFSIKNLKSEVDLDEKDSIIQFLDYFKAKLAKKIRVIS